MDILKNIGKNDLKIEIGIDRMPIQNDLKEKILEALANDEDFGLKNDSGGCAYFIGKKFMAVITATGKGNNVQYLQDETALQNAIKLAILGHSQFLNSKHILSRPNYVQLKNTVVKLLA